ncbi:hypothetical protein GMD93_10965 [Pseudoflavonifractor sp. BIOML-A4]|nr:hypothetical protein [Pseudoflavonifractor sp. BIOML-A4]
MSLKTALRKSSAALTAFRGQATWTAATDCGIEAEKAAASKWAAAFLLSAGLGVGNRLPAATIITGA